jgi:hypothetical protein
MVGGVPLASLWAGAEDKHRGNALAGPLAPGGVGQGPGRRLGP